MGIEPTARGERAHGFEDRGGHQAPVASGNGNGAAPERLPANRARHRALFPITTHAGDEMMKPFFLAALVTLAAPAAMAQTAPPTPTAGVVQAQTRAKALMDRDAYSSDGSKIGEVEDLLLDAQGRVVGVVIEVEGGLGRRDRHISLPFDQVRPGDRRVTLPMTREQIAAMPGFEYRD